MRVGKNEANVWPRNNIKDSRKDFNRKKKKKLYNIFYLKTTFALENHIFYSLRYTEI